MIISLGSWRFFLASLVAISHLWGSFIHGPAAYAVWGFFLLSGYLMTYVLINKYGNTSDGIKSYTFNRFLRIYPLYWIACLVGFISITIISIYGLNDPTGLNPQFMKPHSTKEWFTNITLLPFFQGGGLLVPVSGALATEIGAYMLIPIIAFNKRVALIALVITILINFSENITTIDTFVFRYTSFFTCFLSFTLGSLICHYRSFLKAYESPFLSILAWCLHCLVWLKYPLWPWTYGLYISIILSGWVVLSLSSIKSNKLDTLLGDLSYPVYLFHTIAGIWIFWLFNYQRTFNFFIVSFIITLVISVVLVTLIDKPLRKLKRVGSKK